jgi:ligand-binding sensor domain-containing protein
MNANFRLSIIFLLLLRVCPALAQELTFNYVPTPKGSFNGLGKIVVQDLQGIMWVGQRGLHRYDGYGYTSYYHDPQNPASLMDDWVESLYASRDGFIWVGTHQGLDRFDPATGKFTHFRHNPKDKKSLSNNEVSAILEDRGGVLWIGTFKGLNRFHPKTNTFTRYQHNPADPTSLSHNDIRALYQDRQGTLWVGCNQPFGADGMFQLDGGLNRFKPKTGTFTRYLHNPNDPQSLMDNRVRAIFEDSRGTFWVGTAGDGLHTMNRDKGTFTRHRYDSAHPKKLSRPPWKKALPWVDDHITFITEDVVGAIWIGTANNGLNRYDPQTKQVKHFPNFKDLKSGVQTAYAWWACCSRDGMLWIAYNEGLFRVDPLQKSIAYVATSRPVSAIYQDNTGVIWYGTDQGLVRKDPTRRTEQRFVHNPHNSNTLSNNTVKTIYQDPQGTLWIGTNNGLNRFDAKKAIFTRYLFGNQDNRRLTHYPITSVYEDRRATLWIGTYGGGLYRMNRQKGRFTRYLHNPKDPTSLKTNLINFLYEDRSGSLWVGTHYGGLNRLVSPDGKFQRFLGHCYNINCLVQDSAGILWAGTTGGLYRSDQALTNFSEFIDSTGEFSDKRVVSGILEDRQQALWINGSAGMGRLNSQRSEIIMHIPRSDQRSATDTLNPAYFKSSTGKFYFASGNGYYAFFPEQLTSKAKAPRLILSAFRIADQLVVPGKESPLKVPLWQTNKIRLAHNQNVFSFDFAGIHYGNPERNRHLFMLENLDNTWRKAGEEKTAYYYNVPPGEYVFRVKAANSDGVWAEKTIRVTIAPPWWRTGWFIALVTALIVGLVYSGVRYRIAQVRREEAQKTEFSIKLSEMEMQALRAQMNPHFIFNSLNSINTFILKNEPESASEYLAKFSRLIRLILQNSSAPVVALDSELEALRLYLEMEALRFRNKFTYQIDLDPDLETDEVEIPPLLIQPYVENAIWHGLMHKEGVGHIAIGLNMADDVLTCSIEDDGVGRKRAAELKSKSATRSKSLGMQITSHRIKLINDLHGKQTSMQIVDLVDASGETCGTRVILNIAV